MSHPITPDLWFDTEAGPREAGTVMTVELELLRAAADGVPTG